MVRMKARRKRDGFTLIEIMIVVLIIGILLAIAVGVFTKAKESARRWACVANMKDIDAAKWQWAMEHNKSALDTPTDADILPYLRSDALPVCPAGGDSYAMNSVSERTVCPDVGDFPSHVQP
jgi:prepilin-type N-terminal cleavage/methylation domain-containing protein